jgi:hypothetical protein
MFEDPKCAIRRYQLVKNSIPMTRIKKNKRKIMLDSKLYRTH